MPWSDKSGRLATRLFGPSCRVLAPLVASPACRPCGPPAPPWQSGTAEMAGDAGRASGGKVSAEGLQMAGETANAVTPPAPITYRWRDRCSWDGTSVTSGIDVAAYVAAVALAIVAAVFSIRGMLVLFPGAPIAIIVMAAAMEVAKLVAVAWLARNWRRTGRVARTVLVVLVTGLAIINAAGVYSQLVAAHLGDHATAAASHETEASTSRTASRSSP
jgi:hypothetical protein